jgi:hypothetical protein
MPDERRIITDVAGLETAIYAFIYRGDRSIGQNITEVISRFTITAPSLVRREDAVKYAAAHIRAAMSKSGDTITLPEWDGKRE